MDSGANSYRRFLEGDRNSFTELVAEYWDGLTLYLTGFAESFSEAEELAEETFLKLYTDKPKFSGKSTFKTWLFSVGRYTAYNYIRKRRKIQQSPIDEFYHISDNGYEKKIKEHMKRIKREAGE